MSGNTFVFHQSSGNYGLIEGLTQPNLPGPPPHFHTGYSEQFVMLEGTMEFTVNGTKTTIGLGESIDLPPHTLHTFRHTGTTPCRYLNIHSPKGFAAFFQEFAVDASQADAFDQSVALR